MQISHPVYWLLLYFSVNAFQLHLFYDFVTDTLKSPRLSAPKTLAVFGIACFFLTLLGLYLEPWINLLLVQPTLFLLAFSLYQDRPIKKLLITCLFCAALWIGEGAYRLILLLSRSVPASDLPFLHIQQVSGLFFHCLIAFILIKSYLILTADFFEQLSLHWFLLFLLIPISGLLCYYVIYDLFEHYQMFSWQAVLLTICGITILLSNTVAFYLLESISRYITRSRDLYAIRLRNEMEKRHYQIVQEKNEEYAEMIHDVKHHMRFLAQLAADRDIDAIREYLDNLHISFAGKSQGIYTENQVLNVILNEKASEAARHKITFETEITADIGFLGPVDQCALMGNLLDNALEAAQGCQNAFIRLRIAIFNSGFTVVRVENSCQRPPVKKGNRLRSHKGGGRHGFGLMSVAHIAEKTGGSMEYQYQNGVFRTTVLLNTILPPEEEAARHLVSESSAFKGGI